jgi:hypothetical protein
MASYKSNVTIQADSQNNTQNDDWVFVYWDS